MTLTTTTSEVYGHLHEAETQTRSAEVDAPEPYSLRDLPRLFWAGVLLFAVNIVIVMAIAISPELNVSMYGELPQNLSVAPWRPSPFTERVETVASSKPKPAVKVRPVVYVEPPEAPDLTYSQLNIPRASQASLAIPRMTNPSAPSTDLAIRRATPASLAVYSNSVDVTSRRTSQREQPQVVVY